MVRYIKKINEYERNVKVGKMASGQGELKLRMRNTYSWFLFSQLYFYFLINSIYK